jgi:hypothetical protein
MEQESTGRSQQPQSDLSSCTSATPSMCYPRSMHKHMFRSELWHCLSVPCALPLVLQPPNVSPLLGLFVAPLTSITHSDGVLHARGSLQLDQPTWSALTICRRLQATWSCQPKHLRAQKLAAATNSLAPTRQKNLSTSTNIAYPAQSVTPLQAWLLYNRIRRSGICYAALGGRANVLDVLVKGSLRGLQWWCLP